MASDESRRIILARRARFLSAALAGLASCTPARAPDGGAQNDLVIPPLSADAAATLTDGGLADEEGDGGAALGRGAAAGAGGVDASVPKVIVSVCLSIIMPPKLTFASRAANVGTSGSQMLDMIGRMVADDPQIIIEIEGHTDPTEPAALGQQRADAVRRELERRGVDPKRLTTSNAGATKPIDTNATADGRAHNRRIEFKKQ